MMLIAFNISHAQHTKGHSGSEKTYSNFTQNFYFANAPIWIIVLCNDCIKCQLNNFITNHNNFRNVTIRNGWFLIKSHENQSCLQQTLIKMLKVIVNQTKIQFVITYPYTHMMKTTFIIHDFFEISFRYTYRMDFKKR